MSVLTPHSRLFPASPCLLQGPASLHRSRAPLVDVVPGQRWNGAVSAVGLWRSALIPLKAAPVRAQLVAPHPGPRGPDPVWMWGRNARMQLCCGSVSGRTQLDRCLLI
ncbi:hypothetical protein DPEC_G00279800 [Dallia pectoralis]|uniref:Uncharacterized protein n=1 Tax=Dallia pectoralis TaxID=75939 RepID=A0ACC2FME4_DALPE|nr:hypothetical protein DPEC_G00279800 [Dallia pectoralis]